MGTSDWDGDSWGRGRTPRDGRIGDGARPERRANERPARGGASSWDAERPDRGGRGGARARSDVSPRMSADGWERPRGSRRDDDTWSPPGGRPGGSTGRGQPPTGGYDDERGGSRSRNPRDRREDTFDGRSGSGSREGRPGERMGNRPPRGEEWNTRDRRRGPDGAATRGGATPRGGLWDEEDAPRRRRPDASDPRARSGGRIDPRDPRALRRGLVETTAQPAPPAKKSRFGFGKAFLIVVLMFLIGAGAAYGYFRVSTPTVHGPATSTPAAGTTPSAAPHSNVPAVHPHFVVL